MEKKGAVDNLSTQKHLSSDHDPGWNDPPKWAYSGAQSTSATPTKRMLNKRVAFPLAATHVADKASPSQLTPKSVNMPPPLQSPINLATVPPHSPLIPPSDKATGTKVDNIEIDKCQALNTALANLETVISADIAEKSRTEEIRKRLDIMKQAWLEDKLNNSIFQQILDLSKALLARNIEQADQIHIALMMQHASLCSSWVSGIRHIILELKAKYQNCNSTEIQNPLPQLLPVGEKSES